MATDVANEDRIYAEINTFAIALARREREPALVAALLLSYGIGAALACDLDVVGILERLRSDMRRRAEGAH